MGARKKSAPKRGSLAFSPRKRARSLNPVIKFWPNVDVEETVPLGFAGYKVGMTHIFYVEIYKYSPYVGQEVFSPVTLIETPPLMVIGVSGYVVDVDSNRFIIYRTAYAEEVPDFVRRRIVTFSSSTSRKNLEDIESNLDNIKFIRLLVSTQPVLAGIHKKTPEVFEVQLGGKSSVEEKFEYAKSKLGEEIDIEEVFRSGDVIDVISVSRGKGFQGPVKRWGIKLLSHKSRKSRRKPGALGPWKPTATRYTVPLAGQTGFHRRTLYHVKIMGIKTAEEFDHPLSFSRYGVIKSKFVLLKGSVPGPAKRLVKMRFTSRPLAEEFKKPIEITYLDI
jgi:large subunit ribosomal protein L3